MKRSQPLRADPAVTRAWQQRSRGRLPRGSGPRAAQPADPVEQERPDSSDPVEAISEARIGPVSVAVRPLRWGKVAEFGDTTPAAKAAPKAAKRRRNDSSWRTEVFALRGAHCRRCGTTRDLQCDHVQNRSQGGPSIVENGCVLCRDCHALITECRIRYEQSWLDTDQVAWLAAIGWCRWEADGSTSGRGARGFAPIKVSDVATGGVGQ